MNITQQMEMLTPKEKANFLRDNATEVKRGFYFRKFSEDEVNERKDILVDTCIQIAAKESEFSDVKKKYADDLKVQKSARSELTRIIKQKGEDAEGEIYDFADTESGFMISFDIEGNEISRRRLRPEEKQANLFLTSKQA